VADKKQEEILKEVRRNYKIVFSSKEGAAVLADLENRTGIHNSTFDPDPYRSANLEGMRAVTLFIKSMLKEKKNG
jgi:hypothetical protein|tara:strand:+ start:360 stop:584 length:225 start_codon:yes stop_codon:yes gene_type:complete